RFQFDNTLRIQGFREYAGTRSTHHLRKETAMSEGGFHVHGPHYHELEHLTQHGAGDSFTGRIAVTTALLATVGALFSYQGGATQASAGMAKNNAAIKKTEAANQWNYYQAKSGKQNLAELGLELAPNRRDYYTQGIERYKQE